ncbi:MAG: MFS transporter, partial [Treponema sp.]|nr:MFS transporter [Treponema sp.]
MTRFRRIMLFILLFGTMILFGMLENYKGVSYPLIKTEFNTTWEQYGLMISLLSLSYVGFSIIAGIFLGRFGVKPSFLFGLAAILTGLFSVYFMPNFFTVAVCLFTVFAGFGFLEVGINALASEIFITKTAMLMNLLHAFYGIGAIIGPKTAGLMTTNAGLDWRQIYFFSLPLVLLTFIQAVFIKFPEEKRDGVTEKKINFFDALHTPVVWMLALILGLGAAIESSSPNWGPLYFQDMYGLDPRTGGADFLSSFFICFTVSRLVCGMVLERVGYIRSIIGVTVIVFVIFIAGFCMGEKGIYLLPVLGFFIGPMWPTIMAVAVLYFGKNAPVMASAMIAIGGALNAGIQFLTGLINRFFGPAWGYRSTVVYILLYFTLLIIIRKKTRKTS